MGGKEREGVTERKSKEGAALVEEEEGRKKREEFSFLSGRLYRMMQIVHPPHSIYPSRYIYTVFKARQMKGFSLCCALATRYLKKLFIF